MNGPTGVGVTGAEHGREASFGGTEVKESGQHQASENSMSDRGLSSSD